MPAAPDEPAVTFASLLAEMADRDAIARVPNPFYTLGQFSSYDRASTSPDDHETWFANNDTGQFLRVEERDGRREFVMMDAQGPGAIVRLWSANPKGTLRVYLDGDPAPVVEAPMADVLGGRWKVGPPLAAVRARGFNLYLPIPYARRCKVTSDQGGFYYQINHRAYEPGTPVRTFLVADLDGHAGEIARLQQMLETGGIKTIAQTDPPSMMAQAIEPGGSMEIELPPGPLAVRWLVISVRAEDQDQALRSTVLTASFDGHETVWAPVGDFLGSGVGVNRFQDWWRAMGPAGGGMAFWPMPYAESARFALSNHGANPVDAVISIATSDWTWDDRSMHFHASWRHQHPIRTRAAAGAEDWNYITIQGAGVYAGDSLAVMNPVPDWWGEGDEKIYLDGEAFPSHFGTGTEDYYGYAWGSPQTFSGPFHAQPRADGEARGNNWGHTTVGRVRSLDAIPFRRSLRMDMEIWHWKRADIAYAATAYYYALPGSTSNRGPLPDEASRQIPRPPPLPPAFAIPGAVECESLEIIRASEGVLAGPQPMHEFAREGWSGESQLWVRANRPGDFVELRVPVTVAVAGPMKVTVYATRSWDYGIVRFFVNGRAAGDPVDLFSGEQGKVNPTGAIELGSFEPDQGAITLRIQVVGSNSRSLPPGHYFGLDCVTISPGR